jgi:hypothetical protein
MSERSILFHNSPTPPENNHIIITDHCKQKQTMSPSKPEPDPLEELASAFKKGVKIEDRKYRLTTYKQCFVGSEAVDFMVSSGMAESRGDAVQLGKTLASDFHLFEHVTRDHEFDDDFKFYHFIGEGQRGSNTVNEATGKKVGWSDFLAPVSFSSENQQTLQPKLPVPDFEAVSKKDEHIASLVWPLDEHNLTLLDHVHPPKWIDPAANAGDNASYYDLVVIGAGAGGLVTSAGAAGVGANVALIEEHMLGGDW